LTIKLNKVENKILELLTGGDGVTSVIAVVLGFLTATILLIAIGKNPSGMYQAILQVVSGFDSRRGTWNARYIGEWLVSSVPLILCGLSMGFASRSGLFNIGAEGQYIAGLTAAQVIALFFPPVPVLHWLVAVLGAILAGALWGGIAGFLKAKYKVSEVVSTIMMNYIALYVHRIVTFSIQGTNTFKTPDFPVTASVSSAVMSSVTNGSRLNYGLWFTVLAVVIYWVIMEKTTLGYSLRAAGFNRDAAFYAGMRVNFNITVSMLISGAFAGLAGASVSLGLFNFGRVLAAFDNFGFDGIAVALGGSCTAGGISVVGLLFGMLRSAQPLMQSRQIPREIASIIMGLVVVFISLRAGVQLFVEWRMKERVGREEQ